MSAKGRKQSADQPLLLSSHAALLLSGQQTGKEYVPAWVVFKNLLRSSTGSLAVFHRFGLC
jgi:hypothetical protein